MSTMAAAVLRGQGRLEVEDVPVPSLGDDDVLVEVDLCGVCGTDLHMVLEGWGQPGTWGGHEWVGRVAEVGPAVDRWRVGDAVVGGPVAACGACAHCRAHRPSLCAGRDEPGRGDGDGGAFATYIAWRADELLPLPEGLDPRAAALTEPLAVALHGIGNGGVQPGQRVLVLGAGPIGALSIAALHARGVEVGCAEPGERRQELARAVGASWVVHPDELDVPSIAEPGRVVDGAVDVVLECSGKARAMEAGLAQLVRAGTLVLVGAGIEPPRFDPNRILLNELVITGSFNHDDGGFEAALDLLASGTLPIDALVEPKPVALDGLLDAMHGLAEGRLAGKVLVQP